MDKKIEHLKMIENIIERMGKTSFQLKGWSVTLTTISLTLLAESEDKRLLFFPIIPLIAFWALDSYYLQMERVYKEWYKVITARKEEDIDFCLDISYVPRIGKLSFIHCLLSKTEAGFYFTILFAMAIILAYIDI